MNSAGEEDSARCAATEAHGGGEQLAKEEEHEQPDARHAAVQNGLHRPVANALDVHVAEGEREQIVEHAKRAHADRVLHVFVAREPREQVLHQGEQADEGPCGDAAEHAEDGKGHRLRGSDEATRRELHGGHLEGRLCADQDTSDISRGAGCDHDRQEGARANHRKENLKREHDAAQRRIEGGGDAGTRAGGDQGHALRRSEVDELRERRAER